MLRCGRVLQRLPLYSRRVWLHPCCQRAHGLQLGMSDTLFCPALSP
jgi:hypothetical protein